jgi:hypothetical protein
LALTADAIYKVYENQPVHERAYLGASIMGTECDRALWYQFRLAYPPEQLEGRKLRLFQTGHREEERVVAELNEAGITVDGRQHNISASGGHLQGHLDGVVTNVPEAPDVQHVLEVKTHNEKSFKSLLKDGVAKSKPGHVVQMQLYMHHTKASWALYVAVNKNDDSIYVERVPYDAKQSEIILRRAERTIKAHAAPAKLHEDPKAKSAFACGWCPAKTVCHEGQFARRNCRTCISSTPILDGKEGGWRCEQWDKSLTFAEQLKGCPSHVYLPSLVPGEQIDADVTRRLIMYVMPDGSTWIDGGTDGTDGEGQECHSNSGPIKAMPSLPNTPTGAKVAAIA